MLVIHDANFQVDQAPVLSFELKNDSARVLLSSFGATLQCFEISVPGFEKRDVVLGYSDWVTYKELFDQKQSAYFGAIVGPIAGRIAEAKIPWKDGIFDFEPNEGRQLLHGGRSNFSNVNWQLLSYAEKPFPSVTLCIDTKSAGIELPGNLRCEVSYILKEIELQIYIHSIALEDTIANPTQHSYFNPSGHQGSILDCDIQMQAKSYLEINQNKIPTGKSIDFSDLTKNQSAQIDKFPDYPNIDHAFKLNQNSKQALLSAPDGFSLKFTTNQPYMQVYIGGESTELGKDQIQYHKYSGICLEQQAEPDAPNQENFSDIYLEKGQEKTNFISIDFEQNT